MKNLDRYARTGIIFLLYPKLLLFYRNYAYTYHFECPGSIEVVYYSGT